MRRRTYLRSVSGIALTPTVSLVDTSTRTGISPEQYKRRVPDSIAEFEVEHREHDTESVGTHIYSQYSKHSPHPSIAYTEIPPDTEGGSQIIADVGRLRYGFETVSGAVQFIHRFINRVEYTLHWNDSEGANRYFYDEYTVGDWTLTVQRQLSADHNCTTAVTDDGWVEFENRKERNKVVKQLVQRKL